MQPFHQPVAKNGTATMATIGVSLLDFYANAAVRIAFESLPKVVRDYCWAAVADYEKKYSPDLPVGWVKDYLIPHTPFTTWEFVLGSIFQWHVDFKDDIYSIVCGVRGSGSLNIAAFERMEDLETMQSTRRAAGLVVETQPNQG